MTVMIETRDLVRTFGDTCAVDHLDLEVAEGTVLGLLGPNGAGKTTVVEILATLLRPDGGSARVAGHDVVDAPARVRSSIGLTGQYSALDEHLTGRENLVMVGRLNQLGADRASDRTDELLARFELSDAADRRVAGYSGGMTRRLDLAAGLVAEPRILFLDEPTTGLDPRSRRGMWEIIRDLVGHGVTLLLTTQYLEEADELADRIALIDRGRLVAEGTPAELKADVGGEVLELVVDPDDLDDARRRLSGLASGDGEIRTDEGRLLVPLGTDRTRLAEAVRCLDDAEIGIDDIALRQPSLDDVFFALTGESPHDVAVGGTPDGDERGDRGRSP